MLEKIKTLYNPTPGMPPDKIGPTVGQNSTSTRLPLSPRHGEVLQLRICFLLSAVTV